MSRCRQCWWCCTRCCPVAVPADDAHDCLRHHWPFTGLHGARDTPAPHADVRAGRHFALLALDEWGLVYCCCPPPTNSSCSHTVCVFCFGGCLLQACTPSPSPAPASTRDRPAQDGDAKEGPAGGSQQRQHPSGKAEPSSRRGQGQEQVRVRY